MPTDQFELSWFARTRLLRNSWGPSWGEAGLFKIKRGINDCGIESPNNLLISDPP